MTSIRSCWPYLLCVLLLSSSASGASVLDVYAMDIGGQLHRVDPNSGASLGMFNFGSTRQWNDIAATSHDPTSVYAVSIQLGGGRNFTRIDTRTGTYADIALTNASDSFNPMSYGPWALTFDPRTPHLGYMATAASTSQGVQVNRLARFNLLTRQFETSVATTHRWCGLAMNATGELLGSVDIFDDSHGTMTEIYNIDPLTGNSSLRFTVNSRDVTGLAYHPENGQLYAINAYSSDDLVQLDLQSGAFQTIANLPSGGPNGLAFTSLAGLLGDYNRDDVVDAADYSTWRDAFGQNVTPGSGADGNLNGIVDDADFDVWRQHFGAVTHSAGAAASSLSPQSTPEPSAFASLLVPGMLLFGHFRRR
jgi:hypothetical protein